MEIKAKETSFYTRRHCVLCGGLTEKDEIDFILMDENKKVGFMCHYCFKVGLEGTRKRMKEEALRLQLKALWLLQTAQEDIHFPSLEEVQKLKAEIEEWWREYEKEEKEREAKEKKAAEAEPSYAREDDCPF
jgi:hypothetical protein